MAAVRYQLVAMAVLTVCAVDAPAGQLDLSYRMAPAARAQGQKSLDPFPKDLWRPGSPLNVRGESPVVQDLSYTGSLGLGAWGLAESLRDAGHDKDAMACSVGFGLVAVISAWRLLFPADDPRPAGR